MIFALAALLGFTANAHAVSLKQLHDFVNSPELKTALAGRDVTSIEDTEWRGDGVTFSVNVFTLKKAKPSDTTGVPTPTFFATYDNSAKKFVFTPTDCTKFEACQKDCGGASENPEHSGRCVGQCYGDFDHGHACNKD